MANIYPVVSVVIPYRTGPHDEQTYVMVRERDSGLWNQPGGGVDFADKDFLTAGTREATEESGLTVNIQGLIGLYSFTSRNGNRILCTSLLGKYIGGNLRTNAHDIAEVKDFTLTEIRALNQNKKLRSDMANVRPIEDYLRRGAHSLDGIFSVLS